MSEVPVFVIRPTAGWRLLDVRELWSYRELIYFLVWRDVKVKYKQTAVGVVWALLQPLALVAAFSVFFGRLAGTPSDGAPYPLFALTALLPWQVFQSAISSSTQSLVTDQRLITRVYFPRILVPTAATIAALLDFAIAALLLVPLMAIHGRAPGPEIAWLPAFFALMLVTALGTGFWLSALNVEFRDVAYTLPFLTQLWLFMTPVVYPSSIVPERLRPLYALNPMVGVVDGFRHALLGTGEPGALARTAVPSALAAVALFLTGIVWFRRRERTFVDTIGTGGL